jgi:short-subunit dehydrogenase
MSKDSFTGKLVIVTGGSKGIGKATAKRIGELGGSVCIVARGKKALTEAAEEIKSVQTGEGQFVETIAADCADMDQLSPRLNEFIDKYRVPDYLINCAGYTYPQYVEKLILDDFKKNMDVNYYAQLVPTLILLPHLIERRSGYVANISSLQPSSL